MWNDSDLPRIPYYSGIRRKGISFSPVEIIHITVSILVLTIAFAMASIGGIYGLEGLAEKELLFVFGVSFVAVTTAFLCHELAHKIVAQRYNCWAEYRYFQLGLILALVIALVSGIVFAAPGAVYISGYLDRKQNGKISLAGPMTNIILGLAFLPLFLFSSNSWLIAAGYRISYVNVFLAFFNLLPFPPFDGAKVARWNIGIYIATMTLIILMLILLFWLPM